MRTTLATLFLCALHTSATVVYQQDFEAAGPYTGFSGAGIQRSTGAMSGVGFFHLFNGGSAATQLILSGLASHTTMTVTFHLLQWDSIDWDADIFQIAVNGVYAWNGRFGNYLGPGGCGGGYGCIAGPSGTSTRVTPPGTGFLDPQFGEWFHRDSLHLVTFTMPHTAATAAITWQYPFTEGPANEAFGLDNLTIETNAVPADPIPEPSTIWLAAAGLGVLAAWRRR